MFRLRFDVETMLRVFELNVKNLHFPNRKIAQMRRAVPCSASKRLAVTFSLLKLVYFH